MARHSEAGTWNGLTDASGLCQRPIRCQNTVCPEQLHGVVALGKKQLGVGLAIGWEEEGSPGMQPSQEGR